VLKRLCNVLLGGAALLGTGGSGPASAVTVFGSPNPANFQFIESPPQYINGQYTPGQYTIVNNSFDWYIYGFEVTNPYATSNDDWTYQPFWFAFACYVAECGGASKPYYYYDFEFYGFTGPGDTGTSYLQWDIGPQSSSDQFYFPGPTASVATFFVVNASGATASFTPGVVAPSVPEPATWAMMAAGFGLLGWRLGAGRARPRPQPVRASRHHLRAAPAHGA
jgi:PEP-CTERM motif